MVYKSQKSILETANIITERKSCVITEQFVSNQLGTGKANPFSRVGVLEVLRTGKCTKEKSQNMLIVYQPGKHAEIQNINHPL